MAEESHPGLGGKLRRSLTRRLPPGSPLRRILVNSSWLLLARGASMPLGIVESILVTQLLGAEAFGIFGVVVTFVTVVQRLVSFRMSEFVVKFLTDALAEDRKDKAAATVKAAFLAEGATTLLGFAIAYIGAPLAATYFLRDPGATGMIRGYCFVLLGNALLEANSGILQVFNRFAIQARANVLRKISIVAGVSLAFLRGWELPQVLIAYLLGHTLANLYLATYAWREVRQRLGAGWWRAPIDLLAGQLRGMRSFAITTNLGATLSLIVKDSDVLWIAFFRPPTEAGYYKLATMLLKIPFAAGSPITKAFFPEIAKVIAKKSTTEARRLLGQATRLAAAWVLPVSLGIYLLAPWVIRRFYGEEFLPAAEVIYILVFGMALGQLFFWTRPVFLALGRPDIPFKITLLNTVLKITLTLALVPNGGYLALAWILSGLWFVGVSIGVPLALRGLRRT